FTTLTRRTVSGMSQRLQSLRQKAAQASAFGLSPWCTCTADRSGAPFASRLFSRCSRTTESTPPDRPTARPKPRRGFPGLALGRFLDFLELAIARQALEALLDQLARLFFLQLLQR